MELLQLRYFQKVAELGNMTHAAKYYGIPQPSMSQTISRLEKELGVKLFDRVGGRLYLNEQGQGFLGYVERLLQDLDQGIAQITGDARTISGPARIKVMENHRFILTCIPRFAEMYPAVNISVSHGYYEDQDAPYDLCVSSHRAYKRMTSHVPLIKERVVLAVHEDHPLAKQSAVDISALRGEKLISLPAQSSLYALTHNLCRSKGFEPVIPIICDDPYFIRKYVSENMGVALAPSLSWKGRFRENTVLIPIEDPPLYVSSYLIWDSTHYSSPAVQKFREHLVEEAQKLPGNLVKNP